MSLAKRFFKFVLPSIVSMWVFSLYTMADGIFVAQGVGEKALAAVNLSMPMTSAIFAIGLLLATGTSVVVSISLGQGDKPRARQLFNQNLVVTTVVGLIFTGLIWLNLERVALFLGATPDTLEFVKIYAGTIAGFSVFFMVSYNLEVLVKADGAPQVSTIGVLSCAIMNILLDYIFVMHFHWGVWGAALATGLAQVTSTLLFVVYFIRNPHNLKFERFKPDLKVYRRIVPIGVGEGIAEFSNGLVIFLYNQTILAVIGEFGLVSYTVISYFNTLVLMSMTGTSQGLQPLLSFHYGRGERKTCHTLLKYGLLLVAFFSAVSLAIAQFGAPLITSFFVGRDEAQLFGYTVWAMRLFSVSFALVGFNVVFGGFFAAIEKPKSAMTISLGRGLVLLALSLMVMAVLFGETGVWLSAAVSEGVCLVITLLLVRSYRKNLAKNNEISADM